MVTIRPSARAARVLGERRHDRRLRQLGGGGAAASGADVRPHDLELIARLHPLGDEQHEPTDPAPGLRLDEPVGTVRGRLESDHAGEHNFEVLLRLVVFHPRPMGRTDRGLQAVRDLDAGSGDDLESLLTGRRRVLLAHRLQFGHRLDPPAMVLQPADMTGLDKQVFIITKAFLSRIIEFFKFLQYNILVQFNS